MFEWADNPPEHQLLGFATSQEEFEELQEFAIAERRKFLLSAALAEAASRGLNEPESVVSTEAVLSKEKTCFTDIPLRPVLNLEDCVLMSKFHAGLAQDETDFHKRWIWGEKDAHRIWKAYATDFALTQGFAYAHSKYSSIKTEKKVTDEFMVYPTIPFLMQGITRMAEASIDLEGLQLLLDEYEAGYRPINNAPHPMRFWEGIIEEKRLYDEFYRNSYADVVETMDEGVYVAQYLDEEIVRSGNYISIDDYYKAVTELGGSLKQASTDFTRIVRALAPNYRRFNEYYSAQRVLPNGAVFFEKRLLREARAVVGEQGRNEAAIAAIDNLAGAENRSERFTDEEYRRIVFGE